MLANDILELIGKTPLLKLDDARIYAKLEYFNPLHSVKDRAALYMIEGAMSRGELQAGGTVVEATSGNTGIALAYIAARKGLKLVTVLPENMSEERKKLLRHLGAEVVETPAALGMNGSVERAREIAAELKAFVPDQFSNSDGIKAHVETTAQEIIADLGDVRLCGHPYRAFEGAEIRISELKDDRSGTRRKPARINGEVGRARHTGDRSELRSRAAGQGVDRRSHDRDHV